MPHHQPVAGRMFNVLIENTSKSEIQRHLRVLAENLVNETLTIDKHHIKIPESSLEFSLKYERKPKGELVLKIEIEWESEKNIESMSSNNLKIT